MLLGSWPFLMSIIWIFKYLIFLNCPIMISYKVSNNLNLESNILSYDSHYEKIELLEEPQGH